MGKPESHESKVDKRVHPLARSKPVNVPPGQLGSIAAQSMAQVNKDVDPAEVDAVNKHNSPARHLKDEELLEKFIRETLDELERDDDEALDEFSSAGAGGAGGWAGPLQPPKKNKHTSLGPQGKKK